MKSEDPTRQAAPSPTNSIQPVTGVVEMSNLEEALGTRDDYDPLWTPEQVALRLNVSPDWVRDHSSRKEPRLPVIRLGGGPGRAGLLRYRASEIEKFIKEMESLSRGRARGI